MESIYMKKEMTFTKPNMNNLRGRLGRRIMETIKNTKPSDHQQLKKEVDEFERRILAERQNANN